MRGLALAIVLSLVAVAPAQAGTAGRSGDTLSFVANPGEVNGPLVTYSADDGVYDVSDRMPVTAGAGCTQVRDDTAECPAAGVNSISVDLGDGNDLFTPSALPVPITAFGGDGDDEINGATTADGGPGNDKLYAAKTGSTLTGGPGDDRLMGDDGPDNLDGGEGDDYLSGGAGADHLVGGPGLDRIDALGDKIGVFDTIDCQGRDDDIVKAASQDRKVDCGPGPVVTIAAPKTRVRAFVKTGLPFTVTCDRPCGVYWVLRPTKSVSRLVHNLSGIFSRRFLDTDREGFVVAREGPQRFTGRAFGQATKKGLARLRKFTALLEVVAISREGVKTTVDRRIQIG